MGCRSAGWMGRGYLVYFWGTYCCIFLVVLFSLFFLDRFCCFWVSVLWLFKGRGGFSEILFSFIVDFRVREIVSGYSYRMVGYVGGSRFSESR